MDCLLGPRKLDVVKRWPCRKVAISVDLTVPRSCKILNAVTNSLWENLHVPLATKTMEKNALPSFWHAINMADHIFE